MRTSLTIEPNVLKDCKISDTDFILKQNSWQIFFSNRSEELACRVYESVKKIFLFVIVPRYF